MDIIAYVMEYHGAKISSKLELRNYRCSDFCQYQRVYKECFYDIRTALESIFVC